MLERSRTPRFHGISVLAAVLSLIGLPVLGGCGDDIIEPDPALAPFVGDWGGRAMVLTNLANPAVHPDLIQEGATFDLNVQESGLYTAILVFMGRAAPAEIGQLSVSGNVLTMKHQHPDTLTAVSTFTFSGDSLLVLDGNTEFDFNLDGTKEEATLHLELLRK